MEKQTVITVISSVYCSSEYSEKPGCAVTRLTQEDIDKIKHLTKILTDEGLSSVTYNFRCDWFDVRPAFTFGELGSKYLILYDDCEFEDMGEEKDPDADFQYERLSSCEMVVSEHGFYCSASAKHSGNTFESTWITLNQIEVAFSEPSDTPRENYFFNYVDQVPALEDLPKYLNESDIRLSTYAKEKLKKGE